MPTSPSIDVSPEEEAFLRTTIRRQARSYIGISLLALGLSAAGLSFGLRNASADDQPATQIHETHAEQRQALASLTLEIATHREQTHSLVRRLENLEERLTDIDAPDKVGSELEVANQRIASLEAKQANAGELNSPGLHRRLSQFENRISVLELENGSL